MNLSELRIVIFWFVVMVMVMAVTMMTVRTNTKPLPAAPAEVHVNLPGASTITKQISSHKDLQSSDYYTSIATVKSEQHAPKTSSMKLFLGKIARTRHRDVHTAPKSLPLTDTERDFERKNGMRLRKKRKVHVTEKSETRTTKVSASIRPLLNRNNESLNNLTSFKTTSPTLTTEAATNLETSTPIQQHPESNVGKLTIRTPLPVVQTSLPEQDSDSVQTTLESTTTASASSLPFSSFSPVSQVNATDKKTTHVPFEEPQPTKASSTAVPKLPGSSVEFIPKTETPVSPSPVFQLKTTNKKTSSVPFEQPRPTKASSKTLPKLPGSSVEFIPKTETPVSPSPVFQLQTTNKKTTHVPFEEPRPTKASSTTLPKLPGSSVKITPKTETPVSPIPDSTKQPSTLPISSIPRSATTPLPVVSANTSLNSVKQDIQERTSGSECVGPNCRTQFLPANQWTEDAYWAFGSLVTILLLLTVAVLYTGLWKKRNNFSTPISDVNCHAKSSPAHQGKTEIKDLLKMKLHHLKSLNNSPLSSSKRHNSNGRISRSYPSHSDYLPLLTDEDEEEFSRQWGPRTSEHSL